VFPPFTAYTLLAPATRVAKQAKPGIQKQRRLDLLFKDIVEERVLLAIHFKPLVVNISHELRKKREEEECHF